MDINGDGISEVCYIGIAGIRNAYAQTTDGTNLMTVTGVVANSYTMYNTTAGDFDSDGVADDFAFIYLRTDISSGYVKVMDSAGNTIRTTQVLNGAANQFIGITSSNFSNATEGDEIVYAYAPIGDTSSSFSISIRDSSFTAIGGFTASLPAASYILGITSGDLDDDGLAEIAVAYRFASSDTSNITVRVYEMDGTVLAAQELLNGSYYSFAGMTIAGNTTIPEPLTMSLIGGGMILLTIVRKR
jgi:hypothetical protein